MLFTSQPACRRKPELSSNVAKKAKTTKSYFSCGYFGFLLVVVLWAFEKRRQSKAPATHSNVAANFVRLTAVFSTYCVQPARPKGRQKTFVEGRASSASNLPAPPSTAITVHEVELLSSLADERHPFACSQFQSKLLIALGSVVAVIGCRGRFGWHHAYFDLSGWS